MLNKIAKACLMLAAPVLLVFSLWGAIMVLGIGFGSAKDVILDICLVAPFLLYLLALKSQRAAMFSLATWFIFQWLFRSFYLTQSRKLINPFDNGWDFGLLVIFAIPVWALWIDSRSPCQVNQNSPNH
jgi:hypothetical protein